MIIRSDGKTYVNVQEASLDMDISVGNLNRGITGKRKTVGGFGWCEGEIKLENNLPRFEAKKEIPKECLEAVEKVVIEEIGETVFEKDMVSMSISATTEDEPVTIETVKEASEKLVIYAGDTKAATCKPCEVGELIGSIENAKKETGIPYEVSATPEAVLVALKSKGIKLVQGLPGIVFAEFEGNGSLKPGWITLQDLAKKLTWKNGKLRGYSRYRQLISGMPEDIKDRVGNTHVVKEKQAREYIASLEG